MHQVAADGIYNSNKNSSIIRLRLRDKNTGLNSKCFAVTGYKVRSFGRSKILKTTFVTELALQGTRDAVQLLLYYFMQCGSVYDGRKGFSYAVYAVVLSHQFSSNSLLLRHFIFPCILYDRTYI